VLLILVVMRRVVIIHVGGVVIIHVGFVDIGGHETSGDYACRFC
jgi:hypothetical protein